MAQGRVEWVYIHISLPYIAARRENIVIISIISIIAHILDAEVGAAELNHHECKMKRSAYQTCVQARIHGLDNTSSDEYIYIYIFRGLSLPVVAHSSLSGCHDRHSAM